jgi:hypothetical protein
MIGYGSWGGGGDPANCIGCGGIDPPVLRARAKAAARSVLAGGGPRGGGGIVTRTVLAGGGPRGGGGIARVGGQGGPGKRRGVSTTVSVAAASPIAAKATGSAGSAGDVCTA